MAFKYKIVFDTDYKDVVADEIRDTSPAWIIFYLENKPILKVNRDKVVYIEPLEEITGTLEEITGITENG